MLTVDAGQRGSSTRARVGFWWFALTAAAIAVFAPLPYLTESLRGLSEDEGGIAANYVDRSTAIQAALYVHVIFGGLALLLSPAQFVARLRAAVPRVHRVCGRVVFVSIGLAGVAGAVLSTTNLAGPINVGAWSVAHA